MLRKLNFTERTRIPRGAVQIALRRERDGVLAFDSHLDLSSVTAAADARVYIEAYYRTSYMRFDCGTLAVVTFPEDRRLTDIDSNDVVRFRVKIVDNANGQHRIVAAAEDVTVSMQSDEGGTRISLLPVNFQDLGDLPWRVAIESGGPVLELNNRIDGIERIARNDAEFFALVYPAAVREILTVILLLEEYEQAEDADEWWSHWLTWARDLTDLPLPDDHEDRRTWIDEVTSAFCARHRAIERLRSAAPEESE
jgi:hypothetical protein